jgi:hypothetical protein
MKLLETLRCVTCAVTHREVGKQVYCLDDVAPIIANSVDDGEPGSKGEEPAAVDWNVFRGHRSQSR